MNGCRETGGDCLEQFASICKERITVQTKQKKRKRKKEKRQSILKKTDHTSIIFGGNRTLGFWIGNLERQQLYHRDPEEF